MPLLVDPFQGRCGSTLLMTILASSEDVALDRAFPYERRYVAYICRLVEHIGRPFEPSPSWNMDQLLRGPRDRIGPIPFTPLSLERSEFAASATRHLWAALAESLAADTSKPYRYYAEKTFGDNLETLASAGIEVRLLNLVRDPRDVVASIRAFDRKRGYYGFGREAGQTEAAYLAALVDEMSGSLTRMRLRADRHEHMWIRYEDLVTDATAVIDEMSRWMDVDLDPEAGRPRGRSYRRHATTTSPRQSIGRWRAALSSAEASSIESRLGNEMTRLGYVDP